MFIRPRHSTAWPAKRLAFRLYSSAAGQSMTLQPFLDELLCWHCNGNANVVAAIVDYLERTPTISDCRRYTAGQGSAKRSFPRRNRPQYLGPLQIGVSPESRRLSLAGRNRAPAGAEGQPRGHVWRGSRIARQTQTPAACQCSPLILLPQSNTTFRTAAT